MRVNPPDFSRFRSPQPSHDIHKDLQMIGLAISKNDPKLFSTSIANTNKDYHLLDVRTQSGVDSVLSSDPLFTDTYGDPPISMEMMIKSSTSTPESQVLSYFSDLEKVFPHDQPSALADMQRIIDQMRDKFQ
jgi:hypothetical protein